MKTSILRVVCFIGLVLLLLASLRAPTLNATPGHFWYGMQNVQHASNSAWSDSVWRVLGDRFRMNWALTDIPESEYSQGVLDSAKAHGIKVLQYAVHDAPDSLGADSALVFWTYSNAVFIGFEAEGDTILYQWDAYEAPCEPAPYGSFFGEFVRHPDSVSGHRVPDFQADGGDSAWFFDPSVDGQPDSIYALAIGLIRRPVGRVFKAEFRIRADTTACTGNLIHLALIGNTASYGCAEPNYIVLDSTTLSCSAFPDTFYHTFELSNVVQFNHVNIPTVKWMGTAKVWVDWIRIYDDAGLRLQNGFGHPELTEYVERYSYDSDPGIIGFYMMEEDAYSPNVYPQKATDSLIKAAAGDLEGFTEHHYLYKWVDRQQFGGRNAISARLQSPTRTTSIFYPFAAFHFARIDPEPAIENSLTASVDTLRLVLATESCTPGDTTVCLQDVMDTTAASMKMYKELADSTNNKFVPYLQAYSKTTRLVPKYCTDDIDPPWKAEVRAQSEEEAKLLASMALANGMCQ